MTRADLRRRVSVAEWTDWVAYYELEADARKKAQQAQKARR